MKYTWHVLRRTQARAQGLASVPAFVAALLFCTLTHAQELRQVESPRLKLGDNWVFAVRDALAKSDQPSLEMTVTEVSATQVRIANKVESEISGYDWNFPHKEVVELSDTQLQIANKSGSDIAVYDRNLALQQIGERKYATPNQWISFPMQVGKNWEYTTSFVDSKCATTTITIKAKITGWETVTVPAGSFRALRTDNSGSYANICSTGRVELRYWYVPEVKWIVKSSTEIFSNQMKNSRQSVGWIQELKAFDVD